jgi:hypothetical protein
MNECERLFRAEQITAHYSEKQRALVISALVTLNPFADQVQICPNPLEPVALGFPQYMVVGRTRPGIHPQLILKEQITAYFPTADAVPAKVVVYSMGIDRPESTEVPVTDNPPPAIAPISVSSPAERGATTAPTAVLETTGWSKDFILQKAFYNAVEELRATAGFRNPDVGLHFEVIATGGQIGGFVARTGAFVTVRIV